KQEKSTKQAPAPVQNDEIKDPVQLVDLRVGKVLSVKRHENADSLYVEQIGLGEDQPRTVVSGIVNMRGVSSQGMVLVASDVNDPMKKELLISHDSAKPGDVVSVEGFPPKPEPVLNPKKKIFEAVQPFLGKSEDQGSQA
ncbi:nucleic acid-binding protein, partial [Rozella allomycis CSF55]